MAEHFDPLPSYPLIPEWFESFSGVLSESSQCQTVVHAAQHQPLVEHYLKERQQQQQQQQQLFQATGQEQVKSRFTT
jgi:hypothetical protein